MTSLQHLLVACGCPFSSIEENTLLTERWLDLIHWLLTEYDPSLFEKIRKISSNPKELIEVLTNYLSLLGFCAPNDPKVLKVENKREVKINLVQSLVEMILLQKELKSDPSLSIDQMYARDSALLQYVIDNEKVLLDGEMRLFSPQIEIFLNSLPPTNCRIPTTEQLEKCLKELELKHSEIQKSVESLKDKAKTLNIKETQLEPKEQISEAQLKEESTKLRENFTLLSKELNQVLSDFHTFYRTEILVWNRQNSKSQPLSGIGPVSSKVLQLQQQLGNFLQSFENLWTSYTNFTQLFEKSSRNMKSIELINNPNQILQIKQQIELLSEMSKLF